MLHLIAGGTAGFVEASVCHPLDTIKTRMQLRRQATTLNSVRQRSSLHEPNLLLRRRVGGSTSSVGTSGSSIVEPILRSMTGGTSGASSTQNGVLRHQSNLHEPALIRFGGVEASSSSSSSPSVAMLRPPTATATATTKTTVTRSGVVKAPLGPIGTAQRIIQREGFFSLYKGLSAVWTGIVPKMAVRFVSFEYYRDSIHQNISTTTNTNNNNKAPSSTVTFLAGLASGLTEAILVVTPAEVCKIRMQAQYNSLIDPQQHHHRRKYTNVLQTASLIIREEGLAALYKGVIPTMMRQGCNQAVNFTAYQYFKQILLEHKKSNALYHHHHHHHNLALWESLLLGGISGGFGPMVNNPLDVVKTRLQKQVVAPGKQPKYTGLLQACIVIAKEEGYGALWKGITPRLLRIMPGQAITFMTYEAVSLRLQNYGYFVS